MVRNIFNRKNGSIYVNQL
ncbi:hypothetical protein Bhyg_06453 [Pseudolycoriella hygida]|uniref:Uncharacterized protein n=1 Tax=Pseudolycoriella hygida TaxID=35572 RepID=A0A9Q0N2N5_9DIPT|nr:hypothetical protein Bhyg_06453 [Pseudolycoriella hygida]